MAQVQISPEVMAPNQPNKLLSVTKADLAFVVYTGPAGEEIRQLAIVGQNTVILLNHRQLGIGEISTPSGLATSWLKDGILSSVHNEEKDHG